jgi:hypothetical protein
LVPAPPARASCRPARFAEHWPCKAYHDASFLSLRIIDAVPCALIVIAVLSAYSSVSVLDRQMRFDYPEPASARTLLEKQAFACSAIKAGGKGWVRQRRQCLSL